jgi:hypothetical protein
MKSQTREESDREWEKVERWKPQKGKGREFDKRRMHVTLKKGEKWERREEESKEKSEIGNEVTEKRVIKSSKKVYKQKGIRRKGNKEKRGRFDSICKREEDTERGR